MGGFAFIAQGPAFCVTVRVQAFTFDPSTFHALRNENRLPVAACMSKRIARLALST
jgi:hypothetical protein